MNVIDLLDVARELQDFCDKHGWRSCFIGGIAVQRWSQARVTRVADLTIVTGFGSEASYIEDLLSHYRSRVPDPAQFALRSRVLLLSSPGGIGIDISLGALPFESLVVERATPFEFARACRAPRPDAGLALHRRTTHTPGRSQGRTSNPAAVSADPWPQHHSIASMWHRPFHAAGF